MGMGEPLFNYDNLIKADVYKRQFVIKSKSSVASITFTFIKSDKKQEKDDIARNFPQQIAKLTETIDSYKADIAHYLSLIHI